MIKIFNYLMNEYPFAKDNNIELDQKIPLKEINKTESPG